MHFLVFYEILYSILCSIRTASLHPTPKASLNISSRSLFACTTALNDVIIFENFIRAYKFEKILFLENRFIREFHLQDWLFSREFNRVSQPWKACLSEKESFQARKLHLLQRPCFTHFLSLITFFIHSLCFSSFYILYVSLLDYRFYSGVLFGLHLRKAQLLKPLYSESRENRFAALLKYTVTMYGL